MNIGLRIERLVLDGIPLTPFDGRRVQRDIETELARLLSAGGLNPDFRADIALPSVKARDIQVTSSNDSIGIGMQIARAVYGGIGK